MANFSALKTAIQNAIKTNGNNEITGQLLQDILLAMVSTMGDSAINDLAGALTNEASTRSSADGQLQTAIGNEATARENADGQLQTAINAIHSMIDNGYVYAGIATPSSTPASGHVFYIAVQPGTYTNFSNIVVFEGLTILKKNGELWVKEQIMYKDGGVFDISAYKNATYADLTAALNGGTNIPQSIQKGGMSIKFVQSSDNKYVQYFLTKDEWSAIESDWEKMNLEEEVSQLDQEINGSDIPQPTTEDIQTGKYLRYDGIWVELATARYLMIDVSQFKGETLVDLNLTSNDVQYAFIVSYDNSGAVFSDSRIETRYTSAVIPNDANYLYLYFGVTPILPNLHIVGSSQGIVGGIEEIEIHKTITQQSSGIVPKLGFFISYAEPFWRELAGFNSWYFIAQTDCDIYVTDENINFIGIFNNGEISSANYVIRMEKNATGDYALPTEENPYHITEGQLVAISSHNSETFLLNLIEITNGKKLSDDVFFGDSQKQQVINIVGELINQDADNMYVRKLSASSLDIFREIGTSPYYIMFHYEHRQKAFTSDEYPSFYDNWGLMGSSIVSIVNGEITTILSQLYGSEAELAVNVPNGNDGISYVGGYEHGFDNIMTDVSGDRCFRILIDNIMVDESAEFPLKPAGKITIESREQLCQAYTNSNPFAEVYKKFEFSNNGIFITNKMNVLHSINFTNAQFGMMCLWRRYKGNTSNPYLINKAIGNDVPFHIWTVDDVWKESGVRNAIATTTHNRTKITEYGELGVGFSLRVVESTLKPNGGMCVWHNGGGFDKIYFDLTGSYSASQDEELSATVEWEIFGKPINPNDA